MATQIEKKIVKVAAEKNTQLTEPQRVVMSERVKRPEVLHGTTYKLITPQYDHAIYITINHMVLNEGTDHEQVWPFEIFINSKNMENFQWIVAFTRLISAVFRKGGELDFIIEELGSVFDPRGGYFKPGSKGQWMNSLVAEIGYTIERHLRALGLLATEERVVEVEEHHGGVVTAAEKAGRGEYCPKCMAPTMQRQEGCKICTNCGYSSCG